MTGAVRLLRRLELEDRRTVPDGSGGRETGWVALGSVWADISARSAREDFIAALDRPRVRYRILVRAAPFGAPSRPQPEQRFREGSRIFDILTVTEHDAAGRYLEILAEEGVIS